MKQTQAFLSTYTADVSGVCSALFELGGMTVMHDASGCNSTYHTHDEPRWYDMDSLVFISGLSELEAVMGDDEKLIADVVDAARQLHPRFIALAGTPIPMITGCDLPAIAREVEGRTKIPSFAVPSNGIRTYVAGAGQALRRWWRVPAGGHPVRSRLSVMRAAEVAGVYAGRRAGHRSRGFKREYNCRRMSWSGVRPLLRMMGFM